MSRHNRTERCLSGLVQILIVLTLCSVGFACARVSHVRSGFAPRETPASPSTTALDLYVAREDPAYEYKLVSTTEQDGMDVHLLDLTSQRWRTVSEVQPSDWHHWLTVAQPAEVAHTTALLLIGGGALESSPPTRLDSTLLQIAAQTHSVVAELRLVPNQPLHFADEPSEAHRERGRTEDEILSYSWKKYLETDDPAWVAQLPMTKSAVRAMDAVQQFLANDAPRKTSIDSFVVTGGSKRGWTTWLTAAVDPRVKAIIPVVIDMLNIIPSFQHHWGAYGFWAPTIHDYEELGLMELVFESNARYDRLVGLVDPYAYRKRLTMPKFLLNGSQDEFFLPDSAQFYWHGLQGPKHLRYVPNAGHDVADGTDAVESLAAYYAAILMDIPLPEFDWERTTRGIEVTCKTAPKTVRLWSATNQDARDFRTVKLENPYKSTLLQSTRPGYFVAPIAAPEKGWSANFVELEFDSAPGLPPFKFSTQVYVLPDTLPYAGSLSQQQP